MNFVGLPAVHPTTPRFKLISLLARSLRHNEAAVHEHGLDTLGVTTIGVERHRVDHKCRVEFGDGRVAAGLEAASSAGRGLGSAFPAPLGPVELFVGGVASKRGEYIQAPPLGELVHVRVRP
jgi:hypothetical protein